MSGGSMQLRLFRRAIREGKTLMTACAESGLSLTEARLTIAADAANPPQDDAYELIGSARKDCEMARNAKKKDDEVEIVKKPDFDRAIKILKGDLNPLTEEGAKIRGDQAAAWKTIEKDCNCNKKAMKAVHALMRMDPELRDDYLRTLYGGMQAAGIGISEDLVDQMEGDDAPSMPTRKKAPVELHTVN
ncbi:hypothetical protein OOT33_13550 [Sphingobium sp. DEHP117]|uniref:hypothetical protein n=1 Tax=Sphingobium sp. DEHP117 TaxID=2993436 RepID=UPI0027D5FBA6|nr:hypothetical protein [Sphingobium sp. DEHP117]MDQ4421447.1 hypothetical protein [Sphingobium sp. DEHP117]